MSDDKIDNLKKEYAKLFIKYKETEDNLRDNIGSRRDLLTTLSKLESDIENEALAKKNKYVPVTTVDNSQYLKEEIQRLSGMILKSKNISTNNNAFHTKLVGDYTDFQYLYYLYKKDDGLYYKIDKQFRKNIEKRIVSIVEQTTIDTLFEESNKGSMHVSNILEILKEYVDVNNIQPETSLTGRVREGVYGLLGSMNPLRATGAKGGKRIAPAYKSTGDKVRLFIDNKKLHRSIYVKGNGKAKYCKINNEFVLLSKLKNKIINI